MTGYSRDVLSFFLPALASVTVTDPTACVDRERLENELVLLLGARSDDLDVRVYVSGDGEQREARAEVRHRRELLWTRTLDATMDDCPSLPDALALTVHAGLGALPGWSWERPTRRRLIRGSGTLQAGSAWPPDLGFAFRAGMEARVHGVFGVWTRVALDSGLPVRVGTGVASLTSLGLGVGPELAGKAWRVWAGAQGGAGWASGSGFQTNHVVRVPRLVATAGVGRQVAGPLFLGVDAMAPITRVRYTAPTGDRVEPPLRLGIVVGVRAGREKDPRAGEVQRLGWASGAR
ncbi:MAG: hypothetical protein KC656_07515 [Myxococcales bacterium]|nr:hypothetical protein [Myxococcales bacterium]